MFGQFQEVAVFYPQILQCHLAPFGDCGAPTRLPESAQCTFGRTVGAQLPFPNRQLDLPGRKPDALAGVHGVLKGQGADHRLRAMQMTANGLPSGALERHLPKPAVHLEAPAKHGGGTGRSAAVRAGCGRVSAACGSIVPPRNLSATCCSSSTLVTTEERLRL